MVIGERITQIRKSALLSQEAFGESLGVSRQAISKWESGASIPDVEKLILMSKLYNAPVGWILGVEEKQESSELNETQLEMVKEIVKQYTEANQQKAPEPVKKRKLPYILLAAAVIVFAVWCSGLSDKLSGLQDQFGSLQQQVYYVQDSLYSQSQDLTQRIEDILDAQNSLLADYRYNIAEYDLKANTVDIDMYIIPKTYTSGMTVEFTVSSDGKDFTVSGAEGENHKFSARITCALTNSMSITSSLISGDITETQLLGNINWAYDGTLPECYLTSQPWLIGDTLEYITNTGRDEVMELIQSGKQTYSGITVNVTNVNFVILVNGKPAESISAKSENDGLETRWSAQFTFNYDLKDGDTVIFAAVTTDSFDRKNVYYDVGYEVKNGQFDYMEAMDMSLDFLKEMY